MTTNKPPRLLDETNTRYSYATINVNEPPSSELEQKTLEEAAAALRDRLPGRSRRAKGRFRRQQRGEKGDQWRGRLSCYCPCSSYDFEKLTSRLKEEHEVRLPPNSNFGLFSIRWRVKVFFDVLHLHTTIKYPNSTLKSSQLSPRTNMPLPTTLDVMQSNSILPLPSTMISTPTNNSNNNNNSTVPQGTTPQQQHHGESGYHTYDDTEIDEETEKPTQMNDMLNIFDEDQYDIFIFGFGPVVFFGFADDKKELIIMEDLKSFVDGDTFDIGAADEAKEEMEFIYGQQSRVVNDLLELVTNKVTEKLAVCSALAQSSKLSVHEWRLSQTISRNSHIPRQLAEKGIIDMSAEEISQEVGKLFVERNLINLEPSILDTPEFLWNDSEFESVYKNIVKYLEIEPRIEVLNKRLTIVGELLDVLKTQQEYIHANKLEWIIIILVGMEVVLQVVWNILLKDVLGWVGNHNNGSDDFELIDEKRKKIICINTLLINNC